MAINLREFAVNAIFYLPMRKIEMEIELMKQMESKLMRNETKKLGKMYNISSPDTVLPFRIVLEQQQFDIVAHASQPYYDVLNAMYL